MRKIAPILGFIEVIVWLLAIQQIMVNMSNFMCFIAYGLGFATGTYVGLFIEERVSIGKVIIRVIIRKNAKKVAAELRKNKYKVTTIQGKGIKKKITIIFLTLKRKQTKEVVGIIKKHNPRAFYTIEDIRFARTGETPKSQRNINLFRLLTKKV